MTPKGLSSMQGQSNTARQPRRDITGQRFGRWVALSPHSKPNTRWYWTCRCDCGTVKPVDTQALFSGASKSCGCFMRETAVGRAKAMGAGNRTHGATFTPEHKAWESMRARCNNPNTANYAHWGGRGIRVCVRWQDSFENFLADMGLRPSPKHSLDRIDNNGNYEPGNCRWATWHEQRMNSRPRRRDPITGQYMPKGA